jgi:predicted short-subunit dehydrogenase-like oxidoreductase (DUF2520 family)
MFNTIRVVGHGRVGAAFASRLRERGRLTEDEDADLIVLCVPDAAIAEVARATARGPWLAHVSGATPLAALDPHEERFGVHPVQAFVRSRGAEQCDGAWAAVTGESDEARARGRWLADLLGLRAFDLDERHRALYHAGAMIASGHLVTLFRLASQIFDHAGAPPEALVPLMRRTIDNGFEMTGPIPRGDWSTIEAHRAALASEAPDLVPVYEALLKVTRA